MRPLLIKDSSNNSKLKSEFYCKEILLYFLLYFHKIKCNVSTYRKFTEMATWIIKRLNLKLNFSIHTAFTHGQNVCRINTLPRNSQLNEIPALKQLARFYFRREDPLISFGQSAHAVNGSDQLEIARVHSFKKMYETGFTKFHLIFMDHLNCLKIVHPKLKANFKRKLWLYYIKCKQTIIFNTEISIFLDLRHRRHQSSLLRVLTWRMSNG